MIARLRLALVWLLALSGAPALAWGPQGHAIVAEIALANVRPQTAQAVARLLRAAPGLPTPQCPIASLDDAANWPDCLRGDPGRWHATFAWHYQDEPICGRFDPAANCPGGACVTAQITRMRARLADRRLPPVQRLMALAFLAHFLGDLHQPLHVADHDDRGGNAIFMAGMVDHDRPVSLHWFWDTVLVRRALDHAPSLVRRYPAAERARLAGGDVTQWARESYELARRVAYPRAFHGDACRMRAPREVTESEADIRAELPVVRQRLVQAGLRLALVLDEALD